MAGSNVSGVFVDQNNTVYVADKTSGSVRMFLHGSLSPSRNLTSNLTLPWSVLATSEGAIYVDNGVVDGTVDVFLSGSSTSSVVMTVSEACYSLFIDTSNHIYCAESFAHQVVKKWLGDNSTVSTRIAGRGVAGSTTQTLNLPAGTYVDLSFNLYVADCGNDRIQKFPLGQTTAVTVAGNGAANTVILNCPNAVMLDANGYLFVTSEYDGRVYGQGPFGFRCLFGCSVSMGSGANQLNHPRQMSFDTYGNLFVADQLNSRIQKFLLVSNSCSKSASLITIVYLTLIN